MEGELVVVIHLVHPHATLLTDLEMPQTLTEVGVTEADIPELVDELMTYQSFPIAFMNPRDVSAEDAAAIFMSAL